MNPIAESPRLPSPVLGASTPPAPFGPAALDDLGRLLPLGAREASARRSAALEALDALGRMVDPDEPADLLEEGMRALDSARSPGAEVFGGGS